MGELTEFLALEGLEMGKQTKNQNENTIYVHSISPFFLGSFKLINTENLWKVQNKFPFYLGDE